MLSAQPEAITFTFSESVTLVPGGVRVYDATGETVASTAETDGSALSVVLEEEVGEGTLIVAWRVVSGDGHPVSGAHVFSIGEPSAQIIALPPTRPVRPGS
ncbi:copper resistance protein CopC [Microbacterium sp. NIBRBAC000506063]|uniref:copper resistance CopC family protein n=1 Tax=Microbacterium sp. NIBRBAC000506063 TaxID=2734618 RepID=UPI001BB76451|nr:copper resistance CopC family protein [Microbacterium sp. NIBRBAC000506063]QTV80404.1 copper resistance protein CopC [Microbacterium sp. NIBRBAC000506063]